MEQSFFVGDLTNHRRSARFDRWSVKTAQPCRCCDIDRIGAAKFQLFVFVSCAILSLAAHSREVNDALQPRDPQESSSVFSLR